MDPHNKDSLVVDPRNKDSLVVGIHNKGMLIVGIHNKEILVVGLHKIEILVVGMYFKRILVVSARCILVFSWIAHDFCDVAPVFLFLGRRSWRSRPVDFRGNNTIAPS